MAALSYQSQLFAAAPAARPGPDPACRFERIDLGRGAWVEVGRNWFGGTEPAMEHLVDEVDWHRHRRWMYDRMVDEPRLSRWYTAADPLPVPELDSFRRAARRRYGVRFGAVGLNYYRDGRDSVAFHSDRELRRLHDTLVVILTFGAERPFLLRPAGGGPSIDLSPAAGDVLVMGGTCQETWEHAVPKVARGAGPRVSASIRWAAGRGYERKWTPRDREDLGRA